MKLKNKHIVILILLIIICHATESLATEAEVIEGCYPLTLTDVAHFKVPRFEDYGVTSKFIGKPALPDVKSLPRARRFRTMLREGAAHGPNFAGHYTIVFWGCGTGCVEPAIVDARDGRVFFPPGLTYIDGTFVDFDHNEKVPEVTTLRYRTDSSLLIVVGSPEEDEKSTGVTYYSWNGINLEKLKFIQSTKKSCRGQEGQIVGEPAPPRDR
jgi:hypothetical protein